MAVVVIVVDDDAVVSEVVVDDDAVVSEVVVDDDAVVGEVVVVGDCEDVVIGTKVVVKSLTSKVVTSNISSFSSSYSHGQLLSYTSMLSNAK